MPYVEEAEVMHELLDKELKILDSCNLCEMAKVWTCQITDNQVDWIQQLEQTDCPLLLEALYCMADHQNFNTLPFSRFREIMRRNLVVLDEWESLVLETAFVFHKEQLKGFQVPKVTQNK